MERWLEITLETTAARMEALCDKLTENGAEGLVIEEEGDFKAFLERNRQYWDYVDDALLERMRGVARVKFYVTDDDAGRARMAAILNGVGEPSSVIPLKEEDWAYGWQKYYRPISVGERCYIVPEWERGNPVPPGRTSVYLNPGLTFGTGSHTSTQLCLELLERRLKPGDRLLDLGCGSGILSIAALRLGAKEAVGVDIDPKAVDVAYENARLNGIGKDRYLVRAGDVLSNGALADELSGLGPYALVVANIVADVILALSSEVGAFLAPGGSFVCSGIIDTRTNEVENTLKSRGFIIAERLERNGWSALAAMRKERA